MASKKSGAAEDFFALARVAAAELNPGELHVRQTCGLSKPGAAVVEVAQGVEVSWINQPTRLAAPQSCRADEVPVFAIVSFSLKSCDGASHASRLGWLALRQRAICAAAR